MATVGGEGAILAFAKCRNEAVRLPAFLRHYRELGVDRFVVVDNGSTDGSRDYLDRQADVHVVSTAERLSAARGGTAWLNAALDEFGDGSWCLNVDVDELLVYPGSDGASLRMFTRHLDWHRREAVACLLLDLYPAGPVRGWTVPSGDNPLAAPMHFDAGPYVKTRVRECPGVLIRGGVRERVFYPEFRQRGLAARLHDAALHQAMRLPIVGGARWLQSRRRPTPPCLTKVPLVRWTRGSRYLYANHWVSPKRVAAETGVLLHLKFLGDFPRRAREEAARGEYYDGATEYRRYARMLETHADLTLVDGRSVQYRGPDQLVDAGLMQDTAAWATTRTTATA